MTTGCRIQLYGHQYLNPIIKPTLKTVPMNCHSAIVYPFSNHIKNGIKKTLICLQAVIMLSEKNITNTASHSWIGIFFCQGHFNQVLTTKCDISVSRLLGFDTFSNFLRFRKIWSQFQFQTILSRFRDISQNKGFCIFFEKFGLGNVSILVLEKILSSVYGLNPQGSVWWLP